VKLTDRTCKDEPGEPARLFAFGRLFLCHSEAAVFAARNPYGANNLRVNVSLVPF
jgi:hypothetical protein